MLRKSFGSCIPARKSKSLQKEAGDIVAKTPEDDDAAKDTDEEELQQPGEESAPAPEPTKTKSAEDAPEGGEAAPAKSTDEGTPAAEDRDGEQAPESAAEETPRDEGDKAQAVEETPVQDGEEYQWELSCCGVDIPLTKG
jgi:hypothetical protein